ncbi:Protein of unknown function [Gryllus bimaculatus]|nr:Protein of unknown function [Gryllus bimaculatus]
MVLSSFRPLQETDHVPHVPHRVRAAGEPALRRRRAAPGAAPALRLLLLPALRPRHPRWWFLPCCWKASVCGAMRRRN